MREFMQLNNLSFNYNSMKPKTRVERGDRGKSSGRGNKGQKSRSGAKLGDFQGGQISLIRRIPKHKKFFTKNSISPRYEAISLNMIDWYVETGVLKDKINVQDLAFLLRNKKSKIKLIGSSELKYSIQAHFASEQVKKSFENRLELI